MWLDRGRLHRSLGVDLEKREFLTVTEIPVSDLSDFLTKSWMWLETINELIGDVQKLRLDQVVESKRIFSVVVKTIMAQEEKYKVTEAKAHAETKPEYIQETALLNLLTAYEDYLERLYDNLKVYHYMIKARFDYMVTAERGYR